MPTPTGEAMEHKYWKKERCNYPVLNDGISYCWGYASFCDSEMDGLNDLDKWERKSCFGCEFYKPRLFDKPKHWFKCWVFMRQWKKIAERRK